MAVNSGLNLLGSQFVEVGTNEALDINDIVLPAADIPGVKDDYSGFDTTLQVWNGSSYTAYGYCAPGQGLGMFGDDTWDGKWITTLMDGLATVDISAGEGFWIQTSENSTVTMLGQVLSADTTEVAVAPGLNLISGAYPKSINIQDVVPSAELPGVKDDYSGFDTTLQIWNGSSYTAYGYCAPGQGEGMFGDSNWDGKWITTLMDGVADVDFPAGSGFWIQTTGTGSVTFTK